MLIAGYFVRLEHHFTQAAVTQPHVFDDFIPYICLFSISKRPGKMSSILVNQKTTAYPRPLRTAGAGHYSTGLQSAETRSLASSVYSAILRRILDEVRQQ